jgi:hypothetical protein
VLRILLSLIFLTACAVPSSNLAKVDLGMTKTEVVEQMGAPSAARGSINDIEVYEYKLALPYDDTAGEIIGKSALTFFTLGVGAATFKRDTALYWLYFQDGKLASWGQAGDWDAAPRQIYDVRVNQTNLY